MLINESEIMDIQERALTVINESVSDNANIKADITLQEVALDSITFIKMIVALESEFDFEFDDEKLLYTAFNNFQDIINYVCEKVAP